MKKLIPFLALCCLTACKVPQPAQKRFDLDEPPNPGGGTNEYPVQAVSEYPNTTGYAALRIASLHYGNQLFVPSLLVLTNQGWVVTNNTLRYGPDIHLIPLNEAETNTYVSFTFAVTNTSPTRQYAICVSYGTEQIFWWPLELPWNGLTNGEHYLRNYTILAKADEPIIFVVKDAGVAQ